MGLLKAGLDAPRGLVLLFRVVKVRRARLRERREGAKPNGLMAAILAILAMWAMIWRCRVYEDWDVVELSDV
jgi:hypothetical protein